MEEMMMLKREARIDNATLNLITSVARISVRAGRYDPNSQIILRQGSLVADLSIEGYDTNGFTASTMVSRDCDPYGQWQLYVPVPVDGGSAELTVVPVSFAVQPEQIVADPSIILSICIPTYGRADRLLDTVSKLLECGSQEFEVVVCDNASPDDTFTKLALIQDSRISRWQNKVNFGPIKNFDLALTYARGRYSLLMSDEDEIDNKNLVDFIDYLKTGERLGGGLVSVEGSTKFQNTCLHRAGREALNAISLGFTYMSGFFYNRELINIEKIWKHYDNPAYIYPHEVLSWIVAASGDFCFYAPTIVRRGRNAGGSFPLSGGRHFNHPVNMVKQYRLRSEIFSNIGAGLITDADFQAVCHRFRALMLKQNFDFCYDLPSSEKFELLNILYVDVPEIIHEKIIKSLLCQASAEYFEQDNASEVAIEKYEEAISFNKLNVPAIFGKAAVLDKIGRKDEASQAYSEIIDLSNQRWQILIRLLSRFTKLGRGTEVREIVNRLRQPSMDTPDHVLRTLSQH